MRKVEMVCARFALSTPLGPVSAAVGVDLARLLWVRCGLMQKTIEPTNDSFPLPEKYLVPPAAKKGLHGGGFGSRMRDSTGWRRSDADLAEAEPAPIGLRYSPDAH